MDPLQKQYPELTPYQFASNTPIQAIDLDGLEEYHYTLTLIKNKPVFTLNKVVREYDWTFFGLFHIGTTKAPRKDVITYNNGINTNTYEFNKSGYNGTIAKFNPTGGFEDLEAWKENPNISFDAAFNSNFELGLQRGEQLADYAVAAHLTTKLITTRARVVVPKWNGPVDYSSVKEPNTVGPGLETTRTQRQRILDYNKKINGGLLRSDEDGSVLNMPTNVPKGGKADMKQAEVDHIDERVTGGSNSIRNLRVVSKEQNLKKESQRRNQ
ncbi:HNH endonuclease [Pedobacter sp. ISL-68]|uniref:HNH endonuclease signature motif containing protein n=1 Tax=unclassified Pedobacter TaxID=2628915 RepID=UPI001BE8FE50|nr:MULTISPECIES: HNH endonuclease signature motif containing protein [unclassified Pedobacter]MBT2563794.1 HNH endonuclease [Pedobacter sp. ISL-64]MBT2592800.1 HNH endonuclease [Pedobacter sp. ISL-68]